MDDEFKDDDKFPKFIDDFLFMKELLDNEPVDLSCLEVKKPKEPTCLGCVSKQKEIDRLKKISDPRLSDFGYRIFRIAEVMSPNGRTWREEYRILDETIQLMRNIKPENK